MRSGERIFVAGHRGMVGSAIVRALTQENRTVICADRTEVDLTDQTQVESFFRNTKPDHVYLAAAKVGGINANQSFPAQFLQQNLNIQLNIIHSAFMNGVKKLIFLGSSCIYPRLAPQPIKEEHLLTGLLEPTNEAYAIAKIAGLKLCDAYTREYGASHGTDYRCVMPTNLYGPGDNYHRDNSHVVPALIRRFHEAKITGESKVAIWGTGEPLREFLFVDDLASACLHVMNMDRNMFDRLAVGNNRHINIGSGREISIRDLASLIKKVVGYEGEVWFDISMPNGTPRKLLDSSKIEKSGWAPSTGLEEGLYKSYHDFLSRYDS